MVRPVVRRRVIVAGAVQGVYFRDTCRRLAAQQRVRGWVRNLPDGRVEATFEGEPEAVARLVEWSRHGPSGAHVEAVEVFEEQPQGLAGFLVRRTPG